MTSSDKAKETETWMSWAEVVGADGEPLVRAMLAQGSLIKKPHPKLDPKHEATLALPEELRFVYAREVVSTTHEVDTAISIKEGSREAHDESDDDDGDNDKAQKRVTAIVKKSHNQFQNILIDMKIKLGRFDGNTYRLIQGNTRDG